MGIIVCYDDFTYDVVSNRQLDELVTKGAIIGFDRTANWTKTTIAQTDKDPAAAQGRPAASHHLW